MAQQDAERAKFIVSAPPPLRAPCSHARPLSAWTGASSAACGAGTCQLGSTRRRAGQRFPPLFTMLLG